jgi:hypothetical protein
MGFDRRATIHEPGNARFSWPMNYYALCGIPFHPDYRPNEEQHF